MKTLFITFTLLLYAVSATGQNQVEATKIVFLGDSLTAGYGVNIEEAYPSLLRNQLKAENYIISVVNSGISGSTSASGPSRMKWLLKGNPDIVLLALGANDGLRGQDTENMKDNLRSTINLALDQGCKVLLAGMRMPTNYGEEYTNRFYQVYLDLAKEFNIPFIPFLLKDVGGVRKYNLADGLHPNAAGHKIIAKNVIKYLQPLL